MSGRKDIAFGERKPDGDAESFLAAPEEDAAMDFSGAIEAANLSSSTRARSISR